MATRRARGAPRLRSLRRRRCVIALNPDRIGHRYPAYRYEVSREKIREYALATGHDDPQHTADPAEVDLSEVVAPPAFAAVFTLGRSEHMLRDPDLGMHPNLVHGSQRFEFHRPVRGGDTLECRPWIADIADRGRFELLTYRIDCVDARDGSPVVDASTTLVLFKDGA